MRARKVLVSLIAGAALVAALPGTAWAPKIFTEMVVDVPCTAGAASGTFISGGLAVTAVSVDGTRMEADLDVSGPCGTGQLQGTASDVGFVLDRDTFARDYFEMVFVDDDVAVVGSLPGTLDLKTGDGVSARIAVRGEQRLRGVTHRVYRANGDLHQIAKILNSYLGSGR